MSKPINHTLIGTFILGAVALTVASIVAFSSFSFSKKTYLFITYITDSVNGLNPNSDVKLRGVKIGRVKEIQLAFDANTTSEFRTPVVIEIDPKAISKTSEDLTEERVNNYLKQAIKDGMRARVQPSNILTGMLYIEVDFFPGTPIQFRDKNTTGLQEIPSIPSNVSQMVGSVSSILNNLAAIDFKGVTEELRSAARRLNEGVGEIEFKKINDNIVAATDSANKILSDPELAEALRKTGILVENLDALSQKISKNVDPLSAEFSKTAESLRATLHEIDKTTAAIRGVAEAREGTLGQNISDSLERIDDIARSIRVLADQLRSSLPPETTEE